MSNQAAIFHVTDDLAHIAGASVSWKLIPELDHDELCQKLKANGFTFLPEPTTPASALLRVMTQLFQNRNTLIKPVPNPNKSKQPAYGVLPKQDEGEKLTFRESWSCGLDTVGQSTELVFSHSAPQSARDDVDVLYPAALANLGQVELSTWLVSYVKGVLRGVPTIGGAGTYFIGPDEVKVWRRLREVLKDYGIRLYEIPAMRSEQAMECVLESVRQFTQAAVVELQEDLDKYRAIKQNPDPKARKIQTRVLDARLARITEQCNVVERYETIFDTKLTEIRSTFAELQMGFTALASGALETP